MTEAMDYDPERHDGAADFAEEPVDSYYTGGDAITADHRDDESVVDDEDDVLAVDEGIRKHDDTDWQGMTTFERQILLRGRFVPYRGAAELLMRQQVETDAVETIPGYVDSGSELDVFRSADHPGVVFKLPGEETRVENLTDSTMRSLIEGRVRGLLLPGHEQMVGFDRGYDLNAMVCKDVTGTTLWDLTVEERGLITDEHFAEWVRAAKAAQEQGINWDMGTPKNIIHDADRGLTIVDYSYGGQGQSLTQKLVGFAGATVLLEGTQKGEDVPEYALRFRDVCGRMVGAEMAHLIERRWHRDRRLFDA